jgi:hypothetical protein
MSKYISAHPAYTDEDANVIGGFVDKRFRGKVSPKELLEASRAKSSELHHYFEWNDKKAAEQYRIRQAGAMLRCLAVIDDEGDEIKAYHSCRLEGENVSYFSNEQIRNAPDLSRQVIAKAKQELILWKARYDKYQEFFAVVREINKLERMKHGKGKETKGRRKAG